MKQGDFQLPPDLQKALHARVIHKIDVPAAIDQKILENALKLRPLGRRNAWAAAISVAATLLLVAMVYQQLPGPVSPAISARDLNQDGQINILDALALAHVDNVDPRQVDALAMDIVKVGPR